MKEKGRSRKAVDKPTITRNSIDSKSDQLNIVYHSCHAGMIADFVVSH